MYSANPMKITRADLERAVSAGVLQPGQDELLWRSLEQQQAGRPRFDAANVIYYAGALVILGAMGWYLTNAWDGLAGWQFTLVAVAYAVVFILAGRYVWDELGLRVPGGLLFTVAVGMTPLALYGILRQFGWWPQGDPGRFRGFHIWIKGSWITLELGTVLAGAIALRFRRFPFLTAPIAVALWYFSMDVAPLLLGMPTYADREWISIWFGLVMLVIAYAVDRHSTWEDFAFWLYLFGIAAFWGGLSLMDSDSELSKFLYCVINLGLIVASLVLRRLAFLVFGACGVAGYLGHLAYRVFQDSVWFTFALSFLGAVLIAVGVIYQRNRVQIERMLHAAIPPALLALLPPRVRNG